MDWIQTIFIVGSLGGLMFYFISRIDAEIVQIKSRADSQNARIDQLYQMFVDLLKNGRK